MMSHTKGEWIANEGQIYPQETGKTLALIPYFDAENEENEANAKLIAAAPELLDACLQLLNRLDYHGNIDPIREEGPIEDMIQAIAKATN